MAGETARRLVRCSSGTQGARLAPHDRLLHCKVKIVFPMLRIGSIRWRGKCPKHPDFDPGVEGRAGIRSGCERCSSLADIYEHHARMVSMMRRFAPPRPPRRREEPESLQASLFSEL